MCNTQWIPFYDRFVFTGVSELLVFDGFFSLSVEQCAWTPAAPQKPKDPQ